MIFILVSFLISLFLLIKLMEFIYSTKCLTKSLLKATSMFLLIVKFSILLDKSYKIYDEQQLQVNSLVKKKKKTINVFL